MSHVDLYLVKHALDVTHKGDSFLTESAQNSGKVVRSETDHHIEHYSQTRLRFFPVSSYDILHDVGCATLVCSSMSHQWELFLHNHWI